MKRTTAALFALMVSIIGIGSAIAETARNAERGQIHRPRDPYTDGAKAADFDVYGGVATIEHRVGEDIAK